ncbi:MAG: hemin receptor [Cellvibrionaceae bacterium]|nr:hemin receptor [Cellvibrionaceae bacterium]|tara:strand:+ start:51618 stop:52031 length:414 start_codon:yes stop_codon:yes gene_type:complete
MSITARQILLVQESFKQVEPISEQAAEIFYNKLFEYDPNLRSLFKGDLKAQGKKLMATLKVAVNGASNLDELIPVLHDLAERHVGYGVKPQDYTPVGNALLFTLKSGLGQSYTPELRQAWVDTFRLIAKTMKAHAYS